MKNFSPLQIIIMVVFVIAVIVAMLIFSGKIPLGSNDGVDVSGSVTIWGTVSQQAMNAVKDSVSETYENIRVDYVEKNPATFQDDFVNALASGVGPDLVIITPAEMIENKDRLAALPFASLPETTFLSTFVDQGANFRTTDGFLALPFVIDPMVMYYNRDMLSSAFVAQPPATWDDVVALNKKLTRADDGGALITETVALGTFSNILHAKDILTTLIFQMGNRIIDWDPETKKYISTFNESFAGQASPVATAFDFYTHFARSTDPDYYSWNGGLPTDRDQFTAGKLGLYFGYGSELTLLRQKNPNLNFGVTLLPQRKSSPIKMTYGRMHGVAVTKMSPNQGVAFAVAQTMVSTASINAYTSVDSTYVPARKDMLATGVPDDAVKTTMYQSALISRSLIDPDPAAMNAFFKKYVDAINAGISTPDAVVGQGTSLLTSILNRVQKQ